MRNKDIEIKAHPHFGSSYSLNCPVVSIHHRIHTVITEDLFLGRATQFALSSTKNNRSEANDQLREYTAEGMAVGTGL